MPALFLHLKKKKKSANTSLQVQTPRFVSRVAIWCISAGDVTRGNTSEQGKERKKNKKKTWRKPDSSKQSDGEGSRDSHYTQLPNIITTRHSPSICTVGDAWKHRLLDTDSL